MDSCRIYDGSSPEIPFSGSQCLNDYNPYHIDRKMIVHVSTDQLSDSVREVMVLTGFLGNYN